MLGMPGGWELVIVLVVGLLIFGRRLPEIARSVGKSVVEFKKGLKDVKSEIDVVSRPAEPNMLPPSQQEPQSEPPAQPVQSNATTQEKQP
ncbi:MAG: twin-arginine translocase TatA/TatE family subunit [Phycisphaerae bacterium]|nr:twin-arginine translocase TatA/TatE family subunit [Phycisphaerae bacterium]